MNPEPTFYIEADDGLPPEAVALIKDAAAATVRCVSPLLPGQTEWACTFRLGTDAEVRELNKSFRGKDKPTNVLSFPADESMQEPDSPWYLGDIIFAHETIAREAAAQEKTYADHLKHLAVHGLLHIYGYDHINEDDAFIMEKLEIDILKTLNISNPYTKR